MNRLATLCTAALVTLALAPPPAQACGESLLRTGQGLRYQVYKAKVPATVLVYADAARPEVLTGLEAAGHRITLAANAAALDQALLARRYDLVMADAADVGAVGARMQVHAVRAELVLVVPEHAMAQRHANAIDVDASLGQYLKRINQIMKARS